VVVHLAERFKELEADPERYGPKLSASMPAWLKKGLDARGIAAYPEVGQTFADSSYAELLERCGEPLWLPTMRIRRKARHTKALLIGLSEKRTEMLMAEPSLVGDIVAANLEQSIPGSLEIANWIELQRTLFDAMVVLGESDSDRRADAVAPRGGLPLYDDKTIDAAKLLRAPEIARTAVWLAALPPEIVARVRALPQRSATSRTFPASLGAAPADDDEIGRAEGSVSASEIERDLARLTGFYRDLERGAKGLLAIRFRASE
jgi:hypothetical protein